MRVCEYVYLKLRGKRHYLEHRHIIINLSLSLSLSHTHTHTHTHRAKTVATTCEQVITKLVIKELWHICIEGLHRMLLPMLKYDQEGGDDSLNGEVEFTAHHYNSKQCSALEALGDILKDFFSAGEIVRMNAIEKGLKNLRSVIGFYRDTTGEINYSLFLL